MMTAWGVASLLVGWHRQECLCYLTPRGSGQGIDFAYVGRRMLMNIAVMKSSWWKSGLLLLGSLVFIGSGSAQELKVTLLGTGSPEPRMDRFGPSILVEAGSEKLVFDCGRGAAQRLEQSKVAFAD